MLSRAPKSLKYFRGHTEGIFELHKERKNTALSHAGMWQTPVGSLSNHRPSYATYAPVTHYPMENFGDSLNCRFSPRSAVFLALCLVCTQVVVALRRKASLALTRLTSKTQMTHLAHRKSTLTTTGFDRNQRWLKISTLLPLDGEPRHLHLPGKWISFRTFSDRVATFSHPGTFWTKPYHNIHFPIINGSTFYVVASVLLLFFWHLCWLLSGLSMWFFPVLSNHMTTCDWPIPYNSHETGNAKWIMSCECPASEDPWLIKPKPTLFIFHLLETNNLIFIGLASLRQGTELLWVMLTVLWARNNGVKNSCYMT